MDIDCVHIRNHFVQNTRAQLNFTNHCSHLPSESCRACILAKALVSLFDACTAGLKHSFVFVATISLEL